jgi:hypothetical protein
LRAKRSQEGPLDAQAGSDKDVVKTAKATDRTIAAVVRFIDRPPSLKSRIYGGATPM